MTSSVPPSSLEPLDLLRLLLARRRLLIVAPTVIAAIVVVSGLFADRSWTARARIVPQSSAGNLSRLAGLAAQFGVAVPTGSGGQSPDYYADVLSSDGMLRFLLEEKYTDVEGKPLDLVEDLMPSSTLDKAKKEEFALRKLRKLVSTSSGLKTGVISISVKASDPELAKQIAELAITELNRMNVRAQQQIAGQERMFTDSRLDIARNELRRSEDALENFLRANRVMSGAPQLELAEGRLRRDVSLRQQVVVGLAQSFEQSRLDEVRNVPLLSVVEKPVRPALPNSRLLLIKGLFAALATGMTLFASIIVGEWRRRIVARKTEGSMEIEQLARDAVEDLKRPWRLFVRNVPRH
jgi:uncharacterized protein involved in exopolysaccharide biosynthesis